MSKALGCVDDNSDLAFSNFLKLGTQSRHITAISCRKLFHRHCVATVDNINMENTPITLDPKDRAELEQFQQAEKQKNAIQGGE